MNRYLVRASILGFGAAVCALPVAGHAAASVPAAACQRLLQNIDRTDRQIAQNAAEGIGDNSAPRATLRATKEVSYRVQKLTLVEMLRSENCPMPDTADGDVLYADSAASCALAILKATTANVPEECKMDTWVRADKKPSSSP